MSSSTETDDLDMESLDEALFSEKESELLALFEKIEAVDDKDDQIASIHRIEEILKRAKLETVVSDSASFVFDSLGAGLVGVTDAVFSVIDKRPPRND